MFSINKEEIMEQSVMDTQKYDQKNNISYKREQYLINMLLFIVFSTLLSCESEPNKHKRLLSSDSISFHLRSKKFTKVVVGYSNLGSPLTAHFFPGKNKEIALIVAGMHGSELSAIELADSLIAAFKKLPEINRNVIIIPCLFPDNAAVADKYRARGDANSLTGRYTSSKHADPNRQMPSLGKAFDTTASDHVGRIIEPENQILLELIGFIRPTLIISLHSISNLEFAGVFADPRTDSNGEAIGFYEDSFLAIKVANNILRDGGNVNGNRLKSTPNAIYYTDPSAVAKGKFQARNFGDSVANNKRGYGVSFGSWCSTDISDPENSKDNREAIQILTIEFPGYNRSIDFNDSISKKSVQNELRAYTSAIVGIFLQDGDDN